MNLNPQRRLIRQWAKVWRILKRRGDQAGMVVALSRAKLWRNYVNRMEKFS